MGKINVLSFEVANLIAAGEVVDRPASVVKELMENAIDSGADRITVEIQHGGVTFISVSDNGCGMEADELPVAIRRHATSKIKTAADLDGIETLGFRGEALAAIAAVSKMRIISRPKGAPTGAVLEADAGNITGVSERGASEGTRVIVEDLFANVPARRKFLKKDATESMAVCAYVEKIALSRPDIAFKLIVDGTPKIETVGDGNLKNTIYALFGKDFSAKLLAAKMTVGAITVSGFVGRTDNVRANRNYQNFFINGRYVKSKTACAATEQAYTSYIPPEKFPCCILNIDVNPAAVDVNVHPAKLEVKFSDERPVFEAVYYAVRTALESNITRPTLDASNIWKTEKKVSEMTTAISTEREESLKKRQISAEIYKKETVKETIKAPASTTKIAEPNEKGTDKIVVFSQMSAAQYAEEYSRSSHSIKQPGKINKDAPKTDAEIVAMLEAYVNSDEYKKAEIEIARSLGEEVVEVKAEAETEAEVALKAKTEEPTGSIPTPTPTPEPVPIELPKPEKLEYRIVGEVFNSYVIVEKGDTMLLVDKHAAHERIIFEQLKKTMRENEPNSCSQMLMLPLEVSMTSEEIRAILEYKDEICAMGFDFTAGKYSLSVNAIPECVQLDAIGDMLVVMAERIRTSTGSAKLTRDIVFEKALYQASCKAAIKAGREYAKGHVEWIIDKLMELPDITFCPHGRPVAMEMSHKTLDKQFERC